jgi:hypothetical protein
MTTDAKRFLDDVRGYVTDPGVRGNRLGTVDSGYTSGRPRVLFDGETVLGAKTYPYLAAYSPRPSDRVALAPMGTSYVILGAVDPATAPGAVTYTNTTTVGAQILTKRADLVTVNFRVQTTAAVAQYGTILTLPVGYRPNPSSPDYFFGGASQGGGSWVSTTYFIESSSGNIKPLTSGIASGIIASGTVTFPAGG